MQLLLLLIAMIKNPIIQMEVSDLEQYSRV